MDLAKYMERVREELTKERESSVLDSFLGGFFNTGTPFSNGYFKNYIYSDNLEFSDSYFRPRAQGYTNELRMEWEEGRRLELTLPYFTGSLLGLSYVPLDLVDTFLRSNKDSKKEQERVSMLTSSHIYEK